MATNAPRFFAVNEWHDDIAPLLQAAKPNAGSIDRFALANDLNRALAEHWVRSDLRTKSEVEQQATTADEVARAAQTLATHLAQTSDFSINLIRGGWPGPRRSSKTFGTLLDPKGLTSARPLPPIEDVISALSHVATSASEAKKLSNKWTRQRGLRSTVGPMEWFTGRELPRLYDKHFGKAGVSEDGPQAALRFSDLRGRRTEILLELNRASHEGS